MRAALGLVVLLAGCAGPAVLPPPAGGYQAMRFRQPVRLPSVLATIEISAGSVFVADRADSAGPMYCGAAVARDLVAQPLALCLRYADGLLAYGVDKLLPNKPVPLPAGAVEITRL